MNLQLGKNQKVKINLSPKDVNGNPATRITAISPQWVGGMHTQVDCDVLNQQQPFTYFWIKAEHEAGSTSQIAVNAIYTKHDGTEETYQELINVELMDNDVVPTPDGIPTTLGITAEAPVSL